MSTRYELAEESILKLTVSPTFTLICVLKPCRAALPEPDTSQGLVCRPALLFSRAIGLISGVHGAAAEAGPAPGSVRPAATRVSTSSDRHRTVLRLRTGKSPPRRLRYTQRPS